MASASVFPPPCGYVMNYAKIIKKKSLLRAALFGSRFRLVRSDGCREDAVGGGGFRDGERIRLRGGPVQGANLNQRCLRFLTTVISPPPPRIQRQCRGGKNSREIIAFFGFCLSFLKHRNSKKYSSFSRAMFERNSETQSRERESLSLSPHGFFARLTRRRMDATVKFGGAVKLSFSLTLRFGIFAPVSLLYAPEPLRFERGFCGPM